MPKRVYVLHSIITYKVDHFLSYIHPGRNLFTNYRCYVKKTLISMYIGNIRVQSML